MKILRYGGSLLFFCTLGFSAYNSLFNMPRTEANVRHTAHVQKQSNSCKRTYCHKAQTKSYNIKGVRYQPQRHLEYKKTGVASYYGVRDNFHGKKTATGEIFNAYGLTAAHKTLPIPCYVRVTNLDNKKAVILKVNDRGPFCGDRIIDVSEQAAKLLGFHYEGIANVKVETLPEESVELQKHGTEIKNKMING